ncbi:hypothetical protein BRN47_18530 [Xanthomonas oryzae pv. oryzae]|nr:hypothetical protein BRN47_18530 [Xanthomonas oryzae pv. oryzae]
MRARTMYRCRQTRRVAGDRAVRARWPPQPAPSPPRPWPRHAARAQLRPRLHWCVHCPLRMHHCLNDDETDAAGIAAASLLVPASALQLPHAACCNRSSRATSPDR